jgi:hypothetical protein
MNTEGYALLFIEGDRAGEAFLLAENDVTLGRSRSNQIVVNDELVSREHIVFRLQESDIMVEDLDSAHGSFLNDKRLRGILSVAKGDVIQVGSQKLKIVDASEVDGAAELAMKELDAIDKAADQAEAAAEKEDLDKTRFAPAEDPEGEEQDETQYFQAKEYHTDEEDEDDKTRVFDDPDAHTRMLDVEELGGLSASKAPGVPKGKVIMGVVLVALLLLGAGAAVVYMLGQEDVDPNSRRPYSDEQYMFNVEYPAVWQRTLSDPAALIVLELIEDGVSIAYLKVFGEKDPDFEIEGLETGFNVFKEQLAARHQDYILKGSKALSLNDIRIVQYGFSTDLVQGLGLFTYHRNTRLDVEVAVRRERYVDFEQGPEFKRLMISLLKSFSLNEDQVVIEFPPASEEIRRHALSSPAGLKEEALQNALRATDLYNRRNVRMDNLFRALTEYRTAMQKLSALGTRPSEYDRVGRELSRATITLSEEVDDRYFEIMSAEKAGDFDRARFELEKLLRMVPDKENPIHIKAKSELKRYE